MGLLDIFGKKNVSADLGQRFPYEMKTEFVPYRLRSREKNSLGLVVTLKNLTGEPVLSSVVVSLPKQLSFDTMGLAKEKEAKLGTLGANETKESRIDIYGNTGTDKGEYTITVTAFVNYRDYGHILNSMKKRALLEVV